ncbi:response regulator [Shewanella gaetbuli]
MSKDIKQLNVLVIESVDNLRTVITSMLMQMGVQRVFQAKKTASAVSYLSSHQVDVIVCEIEPTRMEGFALLKQIQAESKWAHIPFVVVSSIVEQQAVKRAIQAGISQYIVKPFSYKIFQQRMIRALNKPFDGGQPLLQTTHDFTLEAVERPNPVEQLSILVVDDDPVIRQVIFDLLSPHYDVNLANSAIIALETCQTEAIPDLILLDIVMPEMDGMMMLQQLMQQPKTRHIKVIFLSGENDSSSVIKGFELGAVDYIRKPVAPNELLIRVNTHVENINAQKQANERVDAIYETIRAKAEYSDLLQNHLKNQLTLVSESAQAMFKSANQKNQVETISQIIEHGTERLKELVDVIVGLHDLDNQHCTVKPAVFELVELVENAISMNFVQLKKCNLEIKRLYEPDVMVLAEKTVSRTLVNILFQYAIFIAPRGSAITVKVNMGETHVHCEFNMVEMITDTECKVAFERPAMEQTTGQIKQGLLTAKRLADIQNISLQLNSDFDNGTQLIALFPLALNKS